MVCVATQKHTTLLTSTFTASVAGLTTQVVDLSSEQLHHCHTGNAGDRTRIFMYFFWAISCLSWVSTTGIKILHPSSWGQKRAKHTNIWLFPWALPRSNCALVVKVYTKEELATNPEMIPSLVFLRC
eukprot:EG_transcript_32158